MSLRLDWRPRLSNAARLRFDRHAQSYVLLSPERALRLNSSASEVVRRCTGRLTTREVIAALLETLPKHTISVAELTKDVCSLLNTLQQRQLLIFEAPP